MTGWFLLTNALLCGGIGAALWGVVSLVALKGISWLIIFAGYAIVFPDSSEVYFCNEYGNNDG